MDSTVRCVCGHYLLWQGQEPGIFAICPKCGERIASPYYLEGEGTGDGKPVDEPVEFSFRDHDATKATFRSRGTLLTPWTAGMAGLLGGVVAGSVVLCLNYRALRMRTASVFILLAGVGVTGLILVILPEYLELPTGIEAIPLLGLVIGTQMAGGGLLSLVGAWVLQGRAVAYHRANGGGVAPLASVMKTSLLCAALVFGAEVAWNYPFAWGGVPPTRTAYYGRGQRLVYSVGIPRKTVDRVAGLLFKEGVFRDVEPGFVDVYLLNRGDHVEVRFFVDAATWRNEVAPQPQGPLVRFDLRPQPPRLGLVDSFRGLQQALADGPLKESGARVVVFSSLNKKLAVFD